MVLYSLSKSIPSLVLVMAVVGIGGTSLCKSGPESSEGHFCTHDYDCFT